MKKIAVGDVYTIDGMKCRVYKVSATHITFTMPDKKMMSMTIDEFERKQHDLFWNSTVP